MHRASNRKIEASCAVVNKRNVSLRPLNVEPSMKLETARAIRRGSLPCESATRSFQTNPNGLCQAAQERLPFLLSGLGRGGVRQPLAMAGTGRTEHPTFATRQPQHVRAIFTENFLALDTFDDGARIVMVQAGE